MRLSKLLPDVVHTKMLFMSCRSLARPLFIGIFFLLLCFRLDAEDLATSDGKTFKNVKVMSETTESLKILHDGGIAVLPKGIVPSEFLVRHELSVPAAKDASASFTEETLDRFKAAVSSFVTRDGRSFPTAGITRLEPDGLRIITDSGIAKVKFTDLKPSTQEALGYDPLKASEYAEKAEKKRQEDAATALRIANASSEVDGFAMTLRLNLMQNSGKGWICSGEVLENKDVTTVTSRAGSRLSGPSVIYEERTTTQTVSVGSMPRVMVFGLPAFSGLSSDLQASRQWSGKVYQIGRYLSTLASTQESAVIPVVHVDRTEAVRLIARNGNSVFYDKDAGAVKENAPTAGGTVTGTGFAISADGYVATAAHVVKGASSILVTLPGGPVRGLVVAESSSADMAVLKVERNNLKPLRLVSASSARIGAGVFCVGFPLVGQLGTNAKLSKGTLNSLTGLADDPDFIQMSIPIQPGNSGGPVCNNLGEVLAVVSKTTSTIAAAQGKAGAIPQNVNFASKVDRLISLAATVPGLKLPQSISLALSAEEHVLQSCYLITVTLGGDSPGN